MNNSFKDFFNSDMHRFGGEMFAPKWNKKFSYYFRKIQTYSGQNALLNKIYNRLYYNLTRKNGIEIAPKCNIGAGFYIGHPYCITINPNAIIGDNCNIHKNVTIGQENRGNRKGAPIIGNKVWIGVNSTIVGKIKIGNDVLIAPNSFVNCDIPDHSIVIGNPCKIIYKMDATEGYIENIN